MVRAMMDICPKVLCVLEGGYNLDSIERSACACVEALFSEKELPPLDKSQLLHPGTAMVVHQVRNALARHWPGCL
jgi:acetoin utilization deacetylase AcuC-like enzyme